MNDISDDELLVARCIADFRYRYEKSKETAGGGPSWEKLQQMTGKEIIRMLAPNGFRMAARESEHMDYYRDSVGTYRCMYEEFNRSRT